MRTKEEILENTSIVDGDVSTNIFLSYIVEALLDIRDILSRSFEEEQQG